MTLLRIAPLAVCVALGAAGCSSIESDASVHLRDMFRGAEPRSRTFEGDTRAVYDAAREALKIMRYEVIRGGPAQGLIEAVSAISPDPTLRGSRQIRLTVEILPAAEGSEVRAIFREAIQDDFHKGSGFATETSLHDGPHYEVFFRYLEQSLRNPPEPKQVNAQ